MAYNENISLNERKVEMTETPSVTVVTNEPEAPKKHFFQKKYVIAIAAAAAAMLVSGYILSKNASNEEEDSTDTSDVTEELMPETPELWHVPQL